jgi:hypothetical protein
MEQEILRYVKSLDYRIRFIEKTLEEQGRFLKTLQRFLVKLEQKLGAFDGRVDQTLSQISAQNDRMSPIMQELDMNNR